MADVNANIDVNIDTSNALAQLKGLQRQLSEFYTSISKSSATAALAQRDLQRNLVNSINSLGGFSAELRTIKTTAESFTNSLEKNKFSMREYFRYAAASTRTFSRFFSSEFDTVSKVAEDNVKRLQTQYIKLGRDANGAMKAIAVIPNELNMQDLAVKTQMAAQKQAIFNQLIKQGSTNLLNFGKNTQWAGRQLMVGFTIPLSLLGNVASKTFMDMETAALKFRKVYGDLFTPASETQAALDNVKELGAAFTRYGIAVSDTVSLAADAAAAGFQGLDLQRQVTEATRLQVLGQVDQQKALETTISLQNAFQMSSADLGDAINFLNAVENQTVVSLDDITTAIPKAAPVVKQLGGDVKDLAFFMAAMKEGGINASEGANALKSGLASIINPTNKAKEMLKGFGIDIESIVNKNAGNVKQTVIEFAQALDGLSDLNRQRAIEQLFGKFQLARLSTLFENVTKTGNQASRVLDLATASTSDLASMAEKELGMTAESSMVKFRKSVEQLKLALVPVGEAFLQTVTPIVDTVRKVLDAFNDLSPGVKKAITVMTVAIGAVGPVALMTFGLLANGLANAIKFISILRNGYLRLTGQSKTLGEQTQLLTIEQQDAAAVAHSLDQSHARLIQTFNVEKTALDGLVGAYTRATTAAQNFILQNPGMLLPGRTPKRYAEGVSIVPGTGNTDSVPAMLTPGEAVIPKTMAKKYGSLINGMIADNIPGYKNGIKSMYGGQERILAPYTMLAPGNTPGGFGMSRDFLGQTGFIQSMKRTAVVGGSIEGNIRLTDKAIFEMAQQVDPFAQQITDQLRLAAKEMADSGKAATHISQLFEKKQVEIQNILGKLRSTGAAGVGMSEALRKTFYPTDADIMGGGNVRVPGVDIDEQGRIVRAAPRSLRSGIAAAFQRKLKGKTISNLMPIEGDGTMTRAHVVPESRVMTGGIRPIAGGALSLPYETQMAGRVELERRSAILSEKLGRSDAVAYSQGRKTANVQDVYIESRKRSSPHPMAPKDGTDDGNAYETARQNAIKRRRVATSPGGRVGPGGVIIPPMPPIIPPVGGGGDEFGPMYGPRKPTFVDKTFGRARGRFGTIASNFGQGRYAGVGMAASTAVFAASMMPGKTGELAQKAMPAIFGLQALQMALKLPIPHIKLFAGALLAGVGLVKLVNSAREKERLAIEGLADAATLSKDKLKTLGDFFGIVPTKTPFQTDLPQLVTTQQQRTQMEQLRGSEGFQKTFANDIKSLRKATSKEAELTLKSLAVNLTGQGFAQEQIQTIIDVLREEAGKTDVKLDVKSLNLKTKEGQAGLKASVDEIVNNVNSAFKTGFEKKMVLTGGQGSTGQYYSQWVEQLVPTKELKKQMKSASAELSGFINGISGQLKNGTIGAKEFNESFSNIEKTVREMNKSNPQAAMMLMSNIMATLPENTRKAAQGIKSLDGQMLILKMQALGLTAGITQVTDALKILENPKADPRAIMGAHKTIDAAIQRTIEYSKQLETAIKKAMGGGLTGGNTSESIFAKVKAQILETTIASQNQWTAFNKLRNAGFSIAKSLEFSKDPLLAMFLATAKNKTQIEEIIKLVKAMNAELGKGKLQGFLTGIQASNQLKQNFLKIIPLLQEMGLKTEEIMDLLNDPEIAFELIKGLNAATDKAAFLKQYIDEIVKARTLKINIEISTVQGKINQVTSAAQKAVNSIDARAEVIRRAAQKGDYSGDFAKVSGLSAAQIDKLKGVNLGASKQAVDDAKKAVANQQKVIAGIQKGIDLKQHQIDINNQLIGQQQQEIDKINKSIEAEQLKIKEAERYIDLNFDQPIQALQDESNALSNTLSQIERQEKSINEQYDKQQKAMEEVNKLNQEAIDQGKTRISIADALTKGDISAAAQAVQDLRAQQASAQSGAMQGALDASRQQALGAITVNGQTRAQIEERQYQIQQESFKLEQAKAEYTRNTILPLQNAIKALEDSKIPFQNEINRLTEVNAGIQRDIENTQNNQLYSANETLDTLEAQVTKAEDKLATDEEIVNAIIAALTESEKTKEEWEDIIAKAQAALAKFEAIEDSLLNGANSAAAIKAALEAINGQVYTVTIVQNVVTNGSTGSTGSTSSSGSTVTGTKIVDGKTVVTGMTKEDVNLSTLAGSTVTGTKVIDGRTVVTDTSPSTTPSRYNIYGSMSAKKYGGKILKKAIGGIVPGIGLLDKVPTLLTPGEFVINKKSAQTFGPLLRAVNQMEYPDMAIRSINNPQYPNINNSPSFTSSTINNLSQLSAFSKTDNSPSYTDNSSQVYNYAVDISIDGGNQNPEAISLAVVNRMKQLENQQIRRRLI